MNLDGRLTLLLQECSWVDDLRVALASLPELAADCPPIGVVPLGDGTTVLGIAHGGMGDLATAVGQTLQQAIISGMAGAPREDFNRLADDPLVEALIPLVSQGLDFQARVVPALVVVGLVSRSLHGELNPRLPPKLSKALTKVVGELRALSPSKRAQGLSDVTWAMGGRITRAYAQVYGGQTTVPPLVRRIAADPLMMAFPRGAFERGVDVKLLAYLLASPVTAPTLQQTRSVAEWIIGLNGERGWLRQLFAAEQTDPWRALMHPSRSASALMALPQVATIEELKAHGISAAAAKAFCKNHEAVATAWRDLADALVGWELVSSLVAMLNPLSLAEGSLAEGSLSEGSLTGPLGPVEPHPRWLLSVPRWGDGAKVAVLAVRLTEIRSHLRQIGVDPSVADRAWGHHTATMGDVLATVVADHGLAVFSSCEQALDFASTSRASLSLAGLDVGVGPPIELSQDVQVGMSLVWGPIQGGTDGRVVQLRGPTVSRAIHLCGVPASNGFSRDPIGLSKVAIDHGLLQSKGLTCDAEAANLLEKAQLDKGVAVHTPGSGVEVAGETEDFVQLALRAWWSAGDRVRMLFPLGQGTGPCEVIELSPGQFRAAMTDDRTSRAAIKDLGLRGANVTEGLSVSVSLQPRRHRPAPAVKAMESVDDPYSNPPPPTGVPVVEFAVDAPGALSDDDGYAADLWGPPEETVTEIIAPKAAAPPEDVSDPVSVGDIVTYDGPVLSIEDSEGELAPRPAPPMDWEDDVPTDGLGRPIPEPIPDPEAMGYITTSSVRALDLKQVSEIWDEDNTDPNIDIEGVRKAALLNRPVDVDLAHAFDGYVVVSTDDGVLFGRRYGDRLVDVHGYDGASTHEAYEKFVADKIAEGFAPRMELTTTPPDTGVSGVDLALLNAAYRAMVAQ